VLLAVERRAALPATIRCLDAAGIAEWAEEWVLHPLGHHLGMHRPIVGWRSIRFVRRHVLAVHHYGRRDPEEACSGLPQAEVKPRLEGVRRDSTHADPGHAGLDRRRGPVRHWPRAMLSDCE
jgi:hypothetical protein